MLSENLKQLGLDAKQAIDKVDADAKQTRADITKEFDSLRSEISKKFESVKVQYSLPPGLPGGAGGKGIDGAEGKSALIRKRLPSGSFPRSSTSLPFATSWMLWRCSSSSSTA